MLTGALQGATIDTRR